MAFFLESTFLGLSIFGWDRLSKKAAPDVHMARGRGVHAVGRIHHGGQLLDATPRRLCIELCVTNRSSTTSGPLFSNPVFSVGLPARHSGVAR